jgi:hypothetical protein
LKASFLAICSSECCSSSSSLGALLRDDAEILLLYGKKAEVQGRREIVKNGRHRRYVLRCVHTEMNDGYSMHRFFPWSQLCASGGPSCYYVPSHVSTSRHPLPTMHTTKS